MKTNTGRLMELPPRARSAARLLLLVFPLLTQTHAAPREAAAITLAASSEFVTGPGCDTPRPAPGSYDGDVYCRRHAPVVPATPDDDTGNRPESAGQPTSSITTEGETSVTGETSEAGQAPAAENSGANTRRDTAPESDDAETDSETGGAASTGNIVFPEGIVVCQLNDRFMGMTSCHGPFQTAGSEIDSTRWKKEIGLACGSDKGDIKEYGRRRDFRVFGCGFGINPLRPKTWPNIDQAIRFDLALPERRRYLCDARQDGYCRNEIQAESAGETAAQK